MSENSKIQWCDHTFNPWEGCTKVSPGCQNCYAEARNRRFSGSQVAPHWGKGAERRRTSEANWKKPLSWDRDAAGWLKNFETAIKHGAGIAMPHRPRVFCPSLGDWLDEEVPIEWLADLLDLIRLTPNLDWLLLTKRPGNFIHRLESAFDNCGGNNLRDENELADWIEGWQRGYSIPENVWIGASAEDQQRADERIPALLEIPAKVRFLSCEPLLENVELWPEIPVSGFGGLSLRPNIEEIHWVICGGESGQGARPFALNWARDLRDQCREVGVPFFMKQLGKRPLESPDHDGATGFELAFKDKKGGDMSEWPEEFRVREFPRVESGRKL